LKDIILSLLRLLPDVSVDVSRDVLNIVGWRPSCARGEHVDYSVEYLMLLISIFQSELTQPAGMVSGDITVTIGIVRRIIRGFRIRFMPIQILAGCLQG